MSSLSHPPPFIFLSLPPLIILQSPHPNRPCVLVGYSFGASVGLEVAARHPQLVARLVALAPAWFPDRQAAHARVTRDINLGSLYLRFPWAMQGLCLGLCQQRHVWRWLLPVLARLSPSIGRNLPAAVVQDFMLHSFHSVSQTMSNAVLGHGLAPALAALAAAGTPVHVLHGAADTVLAADTLRAAVAPHRNIRCVVEPGLNHLFPFAHHERTLAYIRQACAGQPVALEIAKKRSRAGARS